MKKKLTLQIGSIVLAVLLIFFTSFMIGSKGGKYPLFFLNHRTVSKVVIKITPETPTNAPIETKNYIKNQYLASYNKTSFRFLPSESSKDWKYKRNEVIYLKPFGKITITMPYLSSKTAENSNLVSICGLVFEVERGE